MESLIQTANFVADKTTSGEWLEPLTGVLGLVGAANYYTYKRGLAGAFDWKGKPKANYLRGSMGGRTLFSTRPRRTRYRSNLGRKPGKYSTRRVTTLATNTGNSDKVAFVNPLIFVEHATDESTINKRRGSTCNVRGVKIKYWFEIGRGTTITSNHFTEPLRVRWAVVNPKNATKALAAPLPGFFIDPNPTTEQSIAFPTTGNHFDYHNRKINRGAYGVIAEGQFRLSNDPGAQPADSNRVRLSTSSKKAINLYIPINRQMEWETTTEGGPEENIFFVWWYCREGDSATTTAFPDGAVNEMHEKTTYFTNSKMFS